MLIAEDIPQFPINARILESVKQRVHLAREIDKLKLLLHRTNSEAGWLDKAAKEMDIIVDEMYPFNGINLFIIYILNY